MLSYNMKIIPFYYGVFWVICNIEEGLGDLDSRDPPCNLGSSFNSGNGGIPFISVIHAIQYSKA
jgi:hypothetical protein